MPDLVQLSRIEDASLNASAPPQQRWIDGWLVRFSPGKARRARCVNAVAYGRLPLDEKLRLASEVYAEAGLPMHLRITPFSQPPSLDADLAALGWRRIEDTLVLVRPSLDGLVERPLPAGLRWAELDAATFAEVVGVMRGSSPVERQAHAERLRLLPVPCRGFSLIETASASPLACGQVAREGGLAGVYDVFTAHEHRGRGRASYLCERMLSRSASEGASLGYLQVGADNHVAQRLYRRLGFADGYGYHYRVPLEA